MALASNPFMPMIQQAASQYGIDPNIFAKLLQTESNFNPNAVNQKSGAAGIGQFMPGTARDLNINPMDPQQAIPGSAKYLRQMQDKFGGDQRTALMAYNWGPGNVQDWQRGGANPNAVPAETRNYLNKILGGGQGGSPMGAPAMGGQGGAPMAFSDSQGQRGGGGFGQWLSGLGENPLFLAGLTTLGGQGAGAGANIARTAMQGRLSREEAQQGRGERARLQRIWQEAFPNGQPNPNHPLLRNVPPQATGAIAAMGPEQGLKMLGQLAMQGAKPPAEPKWGVIGQNEFGESQYGWIDPQTRTTTPAGGTGAAPAAEPVPAGPVPPQSPGVPMATGAPPPLSAPGAPVAPTAPPAGMPPQPIPAGMAPPAAPAATPGPPAPTTGIRERPRGVRPHVWEEQERKRIDAEQAAAKTQKAEQENLAGQASTTLSTVKNIRDEIDKATTPVTGTWSVAPGFFSGTPAGRVRSHVKQLQSSVALQAMMQLKKASSTGATGFGAMNQKELDLLLNDIGALDPDTTAPDIFKQTLDRIEKRWKFVVADIQKNVTPEEFKRLGLDQIGASPGGAAQGAETPPPEGVDAALWNVMTPEERKLWQ